MDWIEKIAPVVGGVGVTAIVLSVVFIRALVVLAGKAIEALSRQAELLGEIKGILEEKTR